MEESPLCPSKDRKSNPSWLTHNETTTQMSAHIYIPIHSNSLKPLSKNPSNLSWPQPMIF
jgi:hypothetical protein